MKEGINKKEVMMKGVKEIKEETEEVKEMMLFLGGTRINSNQRIRNPGSISSRSNNLCIR
jgi:hypothetical protein